MPGTKLNRVCVDRERAAEARSAAPIRRLDGPLLSSLKLAGSMMEADKVMFEIYRESTYTGKYQVVYFTELNEHNKEYEINRAMSGEHFYDGFIKNYRKDEAKEIIDTLIKRLNEGEKLTSADIEAALATHLPDSK